MVRHRLLAAATAAFLALGLSVGGAGAAFAEGEDPSTVVGEVVAPLVEPATEPIVEEPAVEPAAEGTAPEGPVGEEPAPPLAALVLEPVTPPVDTGVKVFVCKYVGTPGVDEELQSGQNPISVSVNAIPNYQGIGSYFADAQGRSFVLSEDTRTGGGQVGEPDISECPAPDNPVDVTPAASATQYSCEGVEMVGGYITVDLTKMGVTYWIEDSEGEDVPFDPATGQTGALPAGDYTVYGEDADGSDDYDVSDFEEVFTIDEFDPLVCTELPPLANWEASVSVTNETCTALGGVTSGSIQVVIPVGPPENLVPLRYFINFDSPGEIELTSPSTIVAAGTYAITAVVTNPADSVNDGGQTAEFEVTVVAMDPQLCGELETLALTGGNSSVTSWLGALAALLTVAGTGLVARRHRMGV